MTTMLSDLVAMLGDEFTVILGDGQTANDDGESLVDRLWAARLLDIADLLDLLLRRSEQERISAGLRAGRQSSTERLVKSLVSDPDSDVSAAAMTLILARGRRRDRFDGPRLAFDDLSAEAAFALVNAIAAVFRTSLLDRFDESEVDQRLVAAASSLLSAHDEGKRMETQLFALVHALDRAGRLDEDFVRSALEESDVSLLVEAISRRAGIGFDMAWQLFSGKPRGLALLARMSALSRDLAGDLIASCADVVGTDVETEIGAFDSISDEAADSSRAWLRLDPAYREAIQTLGSTHGQRTF